MQRTLPLLSLMLVPILALAADPPYPPSKVILKLTWDSETLRTGLGKDGKTGDNWPITWAGPDLQTTSYGDGGGFTDPERGLTLGFARIYGDPPRHRAEDFTSDADTKAGWGNKGIKSSGMLMVDGMLYMFVRNYQVDGNYRHARLAWSRNQGVNWTWADWHFSATFGVPEFIQFGPNYSGARDRYVYIASQDNDDAYWFSPNIVLARVARHKVANRRAYQFFAGVDAKGGPEWDRRIERRKPMFTDPRGTQRISLTYNAGLGRYVLTASHKVGQAPHNGSLGIFDAPEPWGPWTTVYYDDYWSGTNRTYHHKFPTKWMSSDGRTMWLLYSGSRHDYAFCLRKATLEVAPPSNNR